MATNSTADILEAEVKGIAWTPTPEQAAKVRTPAPPVPAYAPRTLSLSAALGAQRANPSTGTIAYVPPSQPALSTTSPASPAPVVALPQPAPEAISFANSQGRIIPAYTAKPTDRVTINGMAMPIGIALSQGILRPDVEGGFKLTAEGEGVVNRYQQQATDHAATAFTEDAKAADAVFHAYTELAPEVKAGLDVLSRAVDRSTQTMVLGELSTTGVLSQRSREVLGQALGVSPEKAAAIVENFNEALSEQASAALVQSGIPESAFAKFHEWVKETNREKTLRGCQITQMVSGDLSAYRALAKTFIGQNPGFREQSYRAAQYDPSLKARVVNGRQVVTIPGGGEMTVAMARKLGFLS